MMAAMWILVGVGVVLGLLGYGAFGVCRSIEGSEEIMDRITGSFMQEDPEIEQFEAECKVLAAMKFLKKLGALAMCLFVTCMISAFTLLIINTYVL